LFFCKGNGILSLVFLISLFATKEWVSPLFCFYATGISFVRIDKAELSGA